MSFAVDPTSDPIRPARTEPVRIIVNGTPVTGVLGQTLAGVMLAAGLSSWRRTSRENRPRGVFCGIGVCFDCVAVVNGLADVRVCQRRACDGDVVELQRDLPSTHDEASRS